MAAHAGFAQHGALEVHARVGRQGAEIGATEGFGRDADFEPGFGGRIKGCYCEAGSCLFEVGVKADGYWRLWKRGVGIPFTLMLSPR